MHCKDPRLSSVLGIRPTYVCNGSKVAAASLGGNSCASGAIGGATSAIVAPLIRDGIYDGTQTVNTVNTVNNGDGTQTTTTGYTNANYNAAIDALAVLAGGSVAAALGQNAAVAANAAANEAINNSTSWHSSTTPVAPLPPIFTMAGPWGAAATLAGMGTLMPTGTGLPPKLSLDDQLLMADGLLIKPSQPGLPSFSGTSLPAWVGDAIANLSGLPNQFGQWANNLLTQPSSCVVSALVCAGLGLIFSTGNGGRLPISETVTADNGLQVVSNSKHTPGMPGNNPKAGTEPSNSLDLFNSTVPGGVGQRYAIDSNGNINRFSDDGNGIYHWSGSTGDAKAPLRVDNIPIDVRRTLGFK